MANPSEYDYSNLYNSTRAANPPPNAQNTPNEQTPPIDVSYTAYRTPEHAVPEYEAAAREPSPQGSAYTAGGAYPPPIYPQPAPKRPKKNGNGKHIAIGAAAIALCGVVGLGGGYLGSTLANQYNPPRTVLQQSTTNPDNTDHAAKTPAAAADSLSVADVVSRVSPSVVEVTTESVSTNPFFGQYVQSGAGSGVIISTDGYIITNNHVISGSSQVKVRLNDQTEYTATLIGTDTKTDIAVLKIDAQGLTAATLGDSDALVVGELALAVGNPMGNLGGTVTDGIISALNREITVENQNMTLLQTSAAVSPGNSGGGLFNADGELIGIVNAKSNDSNAEGLGFAIPINTAVTVAQQLIDNGYVSNRPALGVSVVMVSDAQTAMQYGVTRPGVYIAALNKNGAAEKAGLQVGDLFISLNGTAISKTADLTGGLDKMNVGDTAEVQVVRDDKVVTATVTLEQVSKADATTDESTQDAQVPDGQQTLPKEFSDFFNQFGQ